MAKITGQTGLVLASTSGLTDGNVFIDTSAFTIKVGVQGSLSTDGVSLQALYSFIMTQWKDSSFEMFKFPIESLTDAQFEVKNGWDWADDATRYLIRDGGWNLLSSDNSTIYEVWMNIQTLGSFDAGTDQAYFIHTADGTPTNFQLTGEVNQAVKIYGDASHGSFDYRSTASSNFVVYLRIQGKTYASYNLNVEQAKTELKNISYSLPLSNGTDLDIEASDAYIGFTALESTGVDFTAATKTIATTDITFPTLAAGDRIVISGSTLNDGTYTIVTNADANTVTVAEALVDDADETAVTISSIHQSMTITWGAVAVDFGSGDRDFGIQIDANQGTLQEIYEFVQYQLRNSGDIDDGAGSEVGQISDEMLEFVGPTLKTKLTSDGGVYITDFQVSDTNDLVFVDDLGVERTYPYVAAGTINFNDNLQADGANAKYWMYFADAGGNLYNTSSAIIVKDNDNTDIAGVIGGAASVAFTFDYDGNVQGGRTAAQDAAVVLIAIGTSNAQYVSATGTIGRSTLNSFTLTAAKERNYVA